MGPKRADWKREQWGLFAARFKGRMTLDPPGHQQSILCINGCPGVLAVVYDGATEKFVAVTRIVIAVLKKKGRFLGTTITDARDSQPLQIGLVQHRGALAVIDSLE